MVYSKNGKHDKNIRDNFTEDGVRMTIPVCCGATFPLKSRNDVNVREILKKAFVFFYIFS